MKTPPLPRRNVRPVRHLLITASLAVTGACGPADGGASAIGQPISLGELDGMLAQGSTRVEIKLVPGTLVASEVHVEGNDDDEKIESEIAAIDPAAGTITLSLGGLVVGYGSGTRFRSPSESHVDRADWEAAVTPGTPIEIRRDLPAAAQAPDDASFSAEDLRIADETDEPSLELRIDADNLTVLGATDAILHVLGLDVTIDASTQLLDDGSNSGPGGSGGPSSSFHSGVASADAAAGTLTLATGEVVDASGAGFDPEGDLFTIEAVEAAVAAGQPVRAEGTGTAGTGGVIVASYLKVEVDD